MTRRKAPEYLATAYHEAGHIVVALALGYKAKPATIVPMAHTYGTVRYPSPLRGIRLNLDSSDRARLQAERAIMICLAGPLAQERHRPESWRRWHGQGDHEAAADLALRVCGSDEQADAFLQWLGITARDLVALHWQEIVRVAVALAERKRLEAAEVAVLIQQPISREPAPLRLGGAGDRPATAAANEF